MQTVFIIAKGVSSILASGDRCLILINKR